MKVLFFEAKRDSLREKMRQFNIERHPMQSGDFLEAVFEELQNRITKWIRQYQDFPKE